MTTRPELIIVWTWRRSRCQHILIDDIEDGHDAVAAQGDQSIHRRAPQEHVAGKKRDDRLDPPALGSAALFFGLGQIVGDAGFA